MDFSVLFFFFPCDDIEENKREGEQLVITFADRRHSPRRPPPTVEFSSSPAFFLRNQVLPKSLSSNPILFYFIPLC
ncbi:unnamed protein product [Cuscuta campestris]|uniref:Uncharacterized protein n=1 Tax=Cuscuta campestris TaxID=132261 RepID=A0A484KXA3_9ASTE|nr:unnamed protein product [Cuscuta campestris]